MPRRPPRRLERKTSVQYVRSVGLPRGLLMTQYGLGDCPVTIDRHAKLSPRDTPCCQPRPPLALDLKGTPSTAKGCMLKSS
jgi:hypothetical protein